MTNCRKIPTDSAIKHILYTVMALLLIFVGYVNIDTIYPGVRSIVQFIITLYSTLFFIYNIGWIYARKNTGDEPQAKFITTVVHTYITGKHASRNVDHLTYGAIVAAFSGAGVIGYAILWTFFWYMDFSKRNYSQKIANELSEELFRELTSTPEKKEA